MVSPLTLNASDGSNSLVVDVPTAGAAITFTGTQTGMAFVPFQQTGVRINVNDVAGTDPLGLSIVSTDDLTQKAEIAIVKSDKAMQLEATSGLLRATTTTNTFGTAAVAGGAVVQVNGTSGLGRVYDTVYNKPITISVLQAEISGPIAYNVISNVDAGVYQLQLSGETPVAGSQSLNMFAVDLPSTAVINFSGVEVLPTSVGAGLLSMVSGYFNYDGTGGLSVRVETAGTPWTAVWTLQLIKIA
jgi:hypothetical protein